MIEEYKNAIKRRPKNNEKYARHFLPKPADNDYIKGYIERYFAKQRNNLDALIVEIDKKQYDSHSVAGDGLNSAFYEVLSLRWKLTGTAQEVQKINFTTVKNLEQKMGGISIKLSNPLQFYKQ
jgi:hypothetical protein